MKNAGFNINKLKRENKIKQQIVIFFSPHTWVLFFVDPTTPYSSLVINKQ